MTDPTSLVRAVVAATDGSADAELAVDWAAEEAMTRSALLVILNAHAAEAESPGARRTALDLVDRAADRARRHFPGLDVATEVAEGDPRRMLEEWQHRAAMVVLGSRGRNALRTVWLGSVSYWASRHLAVPTAIVRPLPGRSRSVQRIAVGVDGPQAAPTLHAAFEMAAHHRAPVTVGHAWWDVGGSNAAWRSVRGDAVDPARRAMVELLLKNVASEFPEVDYEVGFASGSVAAYLSDLARSHRALFIGRRLSAPFDHAGLGTVATAVVEHARGVTVVVPADARPVEAEEGR